MTKEQYLAHIMKISSITQNPPPFSEHEKQALELWYDLLHVSAYGYISANELDNPFDYPDYINVIADFLKSRDKPVVSEDWQPTSIIPVYDASKNEQALAITIGRSVTGMQAFITCVRCEYVERVIPIDLKSGPNITLSLPTRPCPKCGGNSWSGSAVWIEE